MADFERDEVPMLSATFSHEDEQREAQLPTFTSRSRSVSIPTTLTDHMRNENVFVEHTGPLRRERRIPSIQMSGPLFINRKHENLFQSTQHAVEPEALEKYPAFNGRNPNDWLHNDYVGKNEHLLRSGQLGMCNDPYCTTCPTYHIFNGQQKNSKAFVLFEHELHNAYYGGTKGWATRISSFLHIPGIMNPHTKVVQQWNKFFAISCLLAIFLDPLFFFVLSVQKDNKCIVISSSLTTTLIVFRSMTDFIYLLHMLLQIRLAYVAPESRVVGAGDLVDDPRKIALNYLSGYFIIDFFVVLPLPQIIVMSVLPKYMESSLANSAKNFLRASILFQYIPRLIRFLKLLAGQSPSGFIFESAWGNFVINLLIFMLSGHVVGSCWYLLGLQRVNQCLRNACHDSGHDYCTKLIDCGHGNNHFEPYQGWNGWKENENASACFHADGFPYGIYNQAVNLSTVGSPITRYLYSLFWGFQQISTLAGNQIPSYFVWEVLFTMGIIGLGLLLFALLIGNMQNFLQSLGRRRLEMSLRRRDVEQWMRHRRLPEELRRQVQESERYNWAATRGVNEEMLLENLPEDLQREIRRHLFKFVKKVRIFALMDEPILDSIRERLRQKTYIKGSEILSAGSIIDKMVFVVRGKMESIGEDKIIVSLSEGDVCGEELLTWCLEHSSAGRDERKTRLPGNRVLSNRPSSRTVRCLTNVEAFVLRAADLEELTNLFARFLRNSRVQGAIRYESHYWRSIAATRIQVAWRYRKKWLSRNVTNSSRN